MASDSSRDELQQLFSCAVEGQADVYGLGIRIGLYILAFCTILSYLHVPRASPTIQVITYLFAISLSIGLLTNRRILYTHELYLVLILITLSFLIFPLQLFDHILYVLRNRGLGEGQEKGESGAGGSWEAESVRRQERHWEDMRTRRGSKILGGYSPGPKEIAYFSGGARIGTGGSSSGSDRPVGYSTTTPISPRNASVAQGYAANNFPDNSEDAIRPTTANSTGSVEYGHARAVTIQNPRASTLTLTVPGALSRARSSFPNRFSTFSFLRDLLRFIVLTFLTIIVLWGYFGGSKPAKEADGCDAKFLGTPYTRGGYDVMLKFFFILLAICALFLSFGALVGRVLLRQKDIDLEDISVGTKSSSYDRKLALRRLCVKNESIQSPCRSATNFLWIFTTRFIIGALWGLVLTFIIAYVETAIWETGIRGVGNISTVSQLVPLMVGILTFLWMVQVRIQNERRRLPLNAGISSYFLSYREMCARAPFQSRPEYGFFDRWRFRCGRYITGKPTPAPAESRDKTGSEAETGSGMMTIPSSPPAIPSPNISEYGPGLGVIPTSSPAPPVGMGRRSGRYERDERYGNGEGDWFSSHQQVGKEHAMPSRPVGYEDVDPPLSSDRYVSPTDQESQGGGRVGGGPGTGPVQGGAGYVYVAPRRGRVVMPPES